MQTMNEKWTRDKPTQSHAVQRSRGTRDFDWWMALKLAALVFLPGGEALSQGYPARTVRIIVPVAPGGGTDLVGRLVSQKLTENLGQTFIVDNRPGGGNVIGSAVAAAAKPDGYTLLVVPISHAVNVSLLKLPFNPVTDFAPIAHLASAQSVLVVHPSLPAKSVAEFVALARKRPGDLAFGSGGNGSSTHLAAELFQLLAKIKLLHVPYKGGDPALISVLSGHTSTCIVSIPTALPHVTSRRLRALGVTGAARTSVLRDIPTIAEGGVAGYDYVGWYGLLAPARTPQPVVDQLNAEVNKILKDTGVVTKLAADGAQPVGGTAAQFAEFIKVEIAKWAKVVKSAGIRAD